MAEHQCPKCGKKCHSQQGLEHHLLYCQPVQPSPDKNHIDLTIKNPENVCDEYMVKPVSEPVVSPAKYGGFHLCAFCNKPVDNGVLVCPHCSHNPNKGFDVPVDSPAPSKPENPYKHPHNGVTGDYLRAEGWDACAKTFEAMSKPKVPSLEQIEKILVSFIEEQDPLCNRTIGAYTTAILKLIEEAV